MSCRTAALPASAGLRVPPARRGLGRPRAHRFTLLELLVAFTILVLLLGVLFAGANAVTSSWRRLRAEQEKFAEVMALDRTLDSILSSAVPFNWTDEEGETVPIFVGEPDGVHLAYLHRLNNMADGAIRFVTLEAAEGYFRAFYTGRPRFVDDFDQELRVSLLAEDVDRVTFRYADWAEDDEDLQWIEQWDPEGERREIPLAIMVTVHWLDGRRETWLRRTAGSGRNERLGLWRPAKISK